MRSIADDLKNQTTQRKEKKVKKFFSYRFYYYIEIVSK